MADAIDDFADAVHAVAAVNALIGSAYSVGRLATEALADYPRVTWVSAGGIIEPTDDIGGRANSGVITSQVRTDAADLQLHIWGSTREATRAILHAIIIAMWEQAHGSVNFGRYVWTTEGAPRSEFATRGAKLILNASVRLPVIPAVGTLTVVASQSHTVSITLPAADAGGPPAGGGAQQFGAAFGAGFQVA